MARKRVSQSEGIAAVKAVLERGNSFSKNDEELVTAVRYLLDELAQAQPGNSVEVRVPPIGVIQCIDGPRHSRGTPSNVVETTPETWFNLALGRVSWAEAVHSRQLSASGVRSSLEHVLPLTIKL